MTEQDQLDVTRIQKLFYHIRANGTRQERGPTIGGMWTVDTWVFGDARCQLMDEGSTQAVASENLYVYSTYDRAPTFNKGSSIELAQLIESFSL
jgi:hypothetical protein